MPISVKNSVITDGLGGNFPYFTSSPLYRYQGKDERTDEGGGIKFSELKEAVARDFTALDKEAIRRTCQQFSIPVPEALTSLEKFDSLLEHLDLVIRSVGEKIQYIKDHPDDQTSSDELKLKRGSLDQEPSTKLSFADLVNHWEQSLSIQIKATESALVNGEAMQKRLVGILRQGHHYFGNFITALGGAFCD